MIVHSQSCAVSLYRFYCCRTSYISLFSVVSQKRVVFTAIAFDVRKTKTGLNSCRVVDTFYKAVTQDAVNLRHVAMMLRNILLYFTCYVNLIELKRMLFHFKAFVYYNELLYNVKNCQYSKLRETLNECCFFVQ